MNNTGLLPQPRGSGALQPPATPVPRACLGHTWFGRKTCFFKDRTQTKTSARHCSGSSEVRNGVHGKNKADVLLCGDLESREGSAAVSHCAQKGNRLVLGVVRILSLWNEACRHHLLQ